MNEVPKRVLFQLWNIKYQQIKEELKNEIIETVKDEWIHKQKTKGKKLLGGLDKAKEPEDGRRRGGKEEMVWYNKCRHCKGRDKRKC